MLINRVMLPASGRNEDLPCCRFLNPHNCVAMEKSAQHHPREGIGSNVMPRQVSPMSGSRMHFIGSAVQVFVAFVCCLSQWSTIQARADEAGPEYIAWQDTYVDGKKIGGGCLTCAIRNGSDYEWSQQIRVSANRLGEPFRQRIDWKCTQDAEGVLSRFEWTVHEGSHESKVTGEREGGQFQICSTSGEESSVTFVSAPVRCRGFAAVEQSLIQGPMQVGERRVFPVLLPILGRTALVSLHAVGTEQLPNVTNKTLLLRINYTTDLGNGKRLDAIVWSDKTGRIVEMVIPKLNQVVRPASKPVFGLGAHGASDGYGSTDRIGRHDTDRRRPYRCVATERVGLSRAPQYGRCTRFLH